jgi:adenylyl-sulfate kinase
MQVNRSNIAMPGTGRPRSSQRHDQGKRNIADPGDLQQSGTGRAPHLGGVLWMTGLSGSGKSTLAGCLHAALMQRGWRSFILDGDLLRETLNADLGFSEADRRENVRRAGEVAALFVGTGHIVIAAFISPYRDSRERLRTRLEAAFHEIHLCTPLEVCEARDPKQLYHKARNGLIPAFTGIGDPYEAPLQPALRLDTGTLDAERCTALLLDYAQCHFSMPADRHATRQTQRMV